MVTYSDDTTETTTEEVLTSRGKVAKGSTTTTESVEIARVQTDDGVIGEDHADMGTRTPCYVADATHYSHTGVCILG